MRAEPTEEAIQASYAWDAAGGAQPGFARPKPAVQA
jgi:hypothetical protein